MLLSNGFAPDPRVAAEASALSEAGHHVTIYAWDRTGDYQAVEDWGGVRIVRCPIRTTYSRGPAQILHFFWFWKSCGVFLKKNPFDVVHCHDLDTLWPGIYWGRRLKAPVIYDAHESYPDMVDHLFPKQVVGMVRRLEAKLLPKTTAVITVGELLARRFEGLGAKKVVVVGNYKKLPTTVQGITTVPDFPLRIIYVGGLNRDRLLAPLVESISGERRYQLTVVGDGPQRKSLEGTAAGATNIRFTGFLPQDRARDLIREHHLVYYAIDGSYLNNQFSVPNALFLAMAAGRPVLTTAVGEIAHIVTNYGCGTVLPDLQPDTIRHTLERYLEDNALWRKQAEQSLHGAITHFNWEYAAKELLELYQDVSSSFHRQIS